MAFLGGIIAPACGFAWGGKYSVIEICTAQGFETKIVDNDQDQPQHIADQCQFCFANAHLTSFLPKTTNIETVVFYTNKIRFNQYETVFLSRVQHDHAARAPPSIV